MLGTGERRISQGGGCNFFALWWYWHRGIGHLGVALPFAVGPCAPVLQDAPGWGGMPTPGAPGFGCVNWTYGRSSLHSGPGGTLHLCSAAWGIQLSAAWCYGPSNSESYGGGRAPHGHSFGAKYLRDFVNNYPESGQSTLYKPSAGSTRKPDGNNRIANLDRAGEQWLVTWLYVHRGCEKGL